LLQRRAWLGLLAAALGVAALVVLLPRAIERAAAALLRAELARRGVEEMAIGELRVGLRGARLEGLVLGAGDLAVDRVEVHYGLRDLLHRRAGRVEVRGVRARGRLGEEVSFGPLGVLAASGAGEQGEGGAPPFRELGLVDARLELDTARGSIVVPADAELRSGDAGLEGSARFRVEAEAGNARGEGEARLEGGEIALSAELEAERLALGTGELVELDASLHTAGAAGRLGGELDLEAEALLPGGLRAELRLPAGIEVTWTSEAGLRLHLTGPGGRLALPGAGLSASGFDLIVDAAAAAGSGAGEASARASLRVARIRDLHEPARFTPLALSARLERRRPRLLGQARLRGADGKLELRVEGSHDLAAGRGEARVSLETEGPALMGLDLTAQLRSEAGRLHLESAEAALLGGRLRAAGVWDPALPESRLLVDVEELDAARLVAELDLDDLSATGRLSGRLPVLLREGALHVEGGRLDAAPPGGVIRYAPAGAAPLPPRVEGMALLLAALRDFRYQELSMTLDGQLAGDLAVGLRLLGSNPAFYDGHPVAFNLNLEAPLVALVRGSLVGLEIPEEIRRGLEAGASKGP
jgi:hypothetical protein